MPAAGAAGIATRGVTIETGAAFEQQMMPHLAAALTLARYLLRETADAEDAVQEAYLQAVRHFAGFRGENAKAWLLTIVRRICYAWTDRERRFPSAGTGRRRGIAEQRRRSRVRGRPPRGSGAALPARWTRSRFPFAR